MANRETFVTNAAETTLSSSLAAGATTINVTSTSAFPPVPFYAVIDPDVNTSREIILVDSAKTATTFTLTAASKRGQDGTTDTSHSSGAKVVCVPIAALWTDINDRVDAVSTTATAAYTPGGTDVAVADGGTGASTAAAARTNLAVVGTVGGDTITASAATVKPLVVKGAAGQTANLTEWQDSTGAVLTRVAAGGALFTRNLAVVGDTAGIVQLSVQGAAAQTGNLQEWKNSAGAVLFAVRSDGQIQIATSNNLTGTATAGGGAAVPATVAGFVKFLDHTGAERRIPYFAA